MSRQSLAVKAAIVFFGFFFGALVATFGLIFWAVMVKQ